MPKDQPYIVIPTVTARPIAFRGPLKSEVLNDFHEQVFNDIVSLSSAVNSINSRLSKAILTLQNENQYLRRKVDSFSQQKQYEEKVGAANNYLISRYIDFSDTQGIFFPNDLDDTRSAMLSAEYGEITLPPNGVENKFYAISVRSNKIVPHTDLDITVKGVFDKGDGQGLVDYERGGLVTEGRPEWAFNGFNDLYWIRKVEFPIDSRVDQVECELTVIVPQGTSSKANTIEVSPFPNGSVDVQGLSTASDLGTNFITVPGFATVDNFVARRYHFPATTVDQVKIRLRQRNWVEENGKKVFYYGLQELGLKLVDYDKSYTYGAPFGSNNSFVATISAPEGYTFTSIQRVDPNPDFYKEDPSSRHVHLRLGTQSSLSSGLIWNSDLDSLPQNLNTVPSISTETIYAFFELNFVQTSGGVLSPYYVGTTPYIKGLGLSFTLAKL